MLPHHGLPVEKPYVFKSKTELAIDRFSELEKPTEADLNRVLVAGQFEQGLIDMLAYTVCGQSMRM